MRGVNPVLINFQAEKFVATKGLKYGQTELIVLWQVDYLQKKQEEFVARKEKKEKKTKDGEVSILFLSLGG